MDKFNRYVRIVFLPRSKIETISHELIQMELRKHPTQQFFFVAVNARIADNTPREKRLETSIMEINPDLEKLRQELLKIYRVVEISDACFFEQEISKKSTVLKQYPKYEPKNVSNYADNFPAMRSEPEKRELGGHSLTKYAKTPVSKLSY
jgi:hypothetical protein